MSAQPSLMEAFPGWRLAACVQAVPAPADWRDVLVQRLGRHPRRLGRWAELALYGARRCLDAADEPVLPVGTIVRVCSLGGPQSAIQTSARQCRAGLPMPFSFMQSQPAQMLAALALYLDWQGDASFIIGRDWPALQALALHEAVAFNACAVLAGSVEEEGERLSTQWSFWRAPACSRGN
jgi:hypothetical protein